MPVKTYIMHDHKGWPKVFVNVDRPLTAEEYEKLEKEMVTNMTKNIMKGVGLPV